MLLRRATTKNDGGRMTDEQLRDEAMTIFLAGHETTANALAWTWYLLAQHPEAEARLHAELDDVLGGRRADRRGLRARCPTRAMVVAESMRLYPPAWAVGRRALEDVEVGGYTIPKGTLVLVSQYVIHRDPRFFPDPERFDPERWPPERQKGRARSSPTSPSAAARASASARPSRGWKGSSCSRRWPGGGGWSRWRRRPVPLQPAITLRPARGIRMRARERSGDQETHRRSRRESLKSPDLLLS